ncbi:hypothetical protein ACFL0H_04110 [Thermodesulfobacteriota bacterium]
MAGKRIDTGTKEKVMAARQGGAARKEIAKRFGISVSSVSRLVKEKKLEYRNDEYKKREQFIERLKRIENIERRIVEIEAKITALKREHEGQRGRGLFKFFR